MSRPTRHPTPADDPGGALARARALGDPTRSTIHHLVAAVDDGLTIGELADEIGVHRTAVGHHLAQLTAAGLVERTTRPPHGRGRPVSVYRAIDGDPYRVLAGWLAEAVRSGRGARDIGIEIGQRLRSDDASAARTAHTAPTADDAIAAVAREAARLGFAPTVREHVDDPACVDVVLERCPFAELAAADPATVCELHRGVAEGIARRVGGATVEDLQVTYPCRGGCRVSLRRDR